MKIGIIDADLIGRERHRFPNLACEKLSGYWKAQGADVTLLLSYDNLDDYDHVYISKVFTDTKIDPQIVETDKIHLGGTGFFFDKAPNLPDEIEHHMPDYHLYDKWIEDSIEQARMKAEENGSPFNETRYKVEYKEYLEYSIGFITRGCFRKCPFCVNQKFDHVFAHSPLEEFYDETRPKLCLLDDNFMGYPHWKESLEQIKATGKPFKFKQGLDERLLTEEKCEMLFSSKYDGDLTFAFDNVSDYKLIHSKLKMIQKFNKNKKGVCFYVLVGFESTDGKDIENAFKRIELLLHYRCLPYVMRYMSKDNAPWKDSKYRGMYISMARWCNQPSLLKKKSFREFCEANQQLTKTDRLCAPMKALTQFEAEHPDVAARYFDIKFGEPNPNIIP